MAHRDEVSFEGSVWNVNASHEGTNLTLTATFMAKVFFLFYDKETKANRGLSHLPKVTQPGSEPGVSLEYLRSA